MSFYCAGFFDNPELFIFFATAFSLFYQLSAVSTFRKIGGNCFASYAKLNVASDIILRPPSVVARHHQAFSTSRSVLNLQLMLSRWWWNVFVLRRVFQNFVMAAYYHSAFVWMELQWLSEEGGTIFVFWCRKASFFNLKINGVFICVLL